MRISIRRLPSNVQPMVIPNITVTPRVIALDPTRGMVYYVTEHHQMKHDRGYSTIRRAFLNGTGSEMIVESRTLKNVEGIDVDWVSGNVYM